MLRGLVVLEAFFPWKRQPEHLQEMTDVVCAGAAQGSVLWIVCGMK